jgi:DNA glycosylase AlkZ-like
MPLDIIGFRLRNQLLSQTECIEPEQIVAWLGAVQSQDYAGAKWALAQRSKDSATNAAIDQAFNDGKILRTHVMRPTWHFVTPADIRWLLALTAPRVHVANAYAYRTLELDKDILKKSNATLEKTLQGGKQLTRAELVSIFKKAGIHADEGRLGYLLIYAELEGLICSGARQGKQFTYALLEERAPQARSLEREEALAELAKRYFRSHGPATLQDFVWWSGLTTKDVRQGIEFANAELTCETINDKTYWFVDGSSASMQFTKAHLLPNYDEYMVGYTDRTSIFHVAHKDKLDSRGNILFQYAIILGGLVAGTWKRTAKKEEVVIRLSPFRTLTNEQYQSILAAAEGYGKFLELPVVIV